MEDLRGHSKEFECFFFFNVWIELLKDFKQGLVMEWCQLHLQENIFIMGQFQSVVKLEYLVPWMHLKTQWYLDTGVTSRKSDFRSPTYTFFHKIHLSEVASYPSPLYKRQADFSPSPNPTIYFILGRQRSSLKYLLVRRK